MAAIVGRISRIEALPDRLAERADELAKSPCLHQHIESARDQLIELHVEAAAGPLGHWPRYFTSIDQAA